MILNATTFEDHDRFMEVFSTKGAERRKQHGFKGTRIFRDPNEDAASRSGRARSGSLAYPILAAVMITA